MFHCQDTKITGHHRASSQTFLKGRPERTETSFSRPSRAHQRTSPHPQDITSMLKLDCMKWPDPRSFRTWDGSASLYVRSKLICLKNVPLRSNVQHLMIYIWDRVTTLQFTNPQKENAFADRILRLTKVNIQYVIKTYWVDSPWLASHVNPFRHGSQRHRGIHHICNVSNGYENQLGSIRTLVALTGFPKVRTCLLGLTFQWHSSVLN